MSEQYRKTIPDLWAEEAPGAARGATRLDLSVHAELMRWLSLAVALDAGGVSGMLAGPRPGKTMHLAPGEMLADGEFQGLKGWPLRAFPSPVPPFAVMFVETSTGSGARRGVYFRGVPEEKHEKLLIAIAVGRLASGWEIGRSTIMRLDAEGNPLMLDGVIPPTAWPPPVPQDDTMAAGLLALSLTHCRNVKLSEHNPPPALSKRHQERHGRQLARYYTLDIEPMRKVLRTEGRMDEVGLARALHLCRGHFKDFREGGGLFGKHKGLYWWEANVRGSVKAGVVAKDYAIKPPRDNGNGDT